MQVVIHGMEHEVESAFLRILFLLKLLTAVLLITQEEFQIAVAQEPGIVEHRLVMVNLLIRHRFAVTLGIVAIRNFQLARFDAGTEVGNLAKSLFGEYTEATVCKMTADGNQRPDLQAMIAATQKLIADGADNIAEAAFIYDGCYCAVDLLHKTPQGYAIYEVKSSTDLKELEVYAQDVAYQKYVLTNCGLNITGTYLVNIDNEYVLDGKLDVKGFFRIYDTACSILSDRGKDGTASRCFFTGGDTEFCP